MKIVILGGGAFGTSFAQQIAKNAVNDVTLLVRDTSLANEINTVHVNSKSFPNRVLRSNIKATTDYNVVSDCDILLIAIPTKAVEVIVENLRGLLNPSTIVINLAKGLLSGGQTIVEYLSRSLKHPNVVSMKGASFSADMINDFPTLFTVGIEKGAQVSVIREALEGTDIYVDFTSDVRGVELLSALKNVYAIALGNVDAKYNSVNTRFLILTKAIEEIRLIISELGAQESTIHLCCGIGDIALTGLNDLSRNRTLGLLMGKGFFDKSMLGNSVVLEGVKTITTIDEIIPANIKGRLPLFTMVKSMIENPQFASQAFDFGKLSKTSYKTVLTYGTFDLLHYGHLELLRRIKDRGDRIIVGLSTDEFNKEKGKECVMTFEKRKALLENLSYVDLVIPESSWEQKVDDVKKYNVDVFVMGDDWEGKFDFLSEYCEVVYLPRTKGISTTKLKSILGDDNDS